MSAPITGQWLDGRAEAVEHLRRAIMESGDTETGVSAAALAHYQMALAHLDQARAALHLAALAQVEAVVARSRDWGKR